ncbi:very short patch repair endonuclease [Desulfatiferula olefinivorans]
MSQVAGKNTRPERLVRSLLHNMGYRFRLHRKDLPGKPDITLPKHKKIIFVHGCFWHGHPHCPRAKRPTTHTAFWNEKLDKTIERDKANMESLKQAGWDVMIIWTCELNDLDALKNRLLSFLTTNNP